jgi:hypothetical protein
MILLAKSVERLCLTFGLFSQLNFDHLSVVSEENSEGNSIIQNEDNSIPIHDLSAFLHSVDVLSPLSYLQKLSKIEFAKFPTNNRMT